MRSDLTFSTAHYPYLIALDWGTTSLRAYLMAHDGSVIEERTGGKGIMQVEDGRFTDALSALCGDWLDAHPAATLIASGMIGSKQGWIESPYCPCPANAVTLAAKMVTIDIDIKAGGGTGATAGAAANASNVANNLRPLHVVPGVSFTDPISGVPDVMRGEETQIIGAISASGAHLVVLPGTHSKWVWVQDGAILRFSSWMTGEVYAALTQHTILGRLMNLDAEHDDAAFMRGVRYGYANPATLLHEIFSARTLGLFGQLDSAALPSYLSGLLIGAEIGGALNKIDQTPAITILGSSALTERYAIALEKCGITTQAGSLNSAAKGLFRLARSTSKVS